MPSLKAAVEAKCKDCIYDPYSPGSWRSQVESCRSEDCPLWPVRPLTIETNNALRKTKSLTRLVDALEDDDGDE